MGVLKVKSTYVLIVVVVVGCSKIFISIENIYTTYTTFSILRCVVSDGIFLAFLVHESFSSNFYRLNKKVLVINAVFVIILK